ncbi:MAG: nitronate monooxygenase family protein [Lachnospiraceae bacterium]|nr:nitronate monooxygenase family protein [Lachnospiraceae bacterium]
MKELRIGNKKARIPVVQGGMGVGVSRSCLAGAVAKAGGVGIISTAQIGYDEPDFADNHKEANKRAIEKHIRIAKAQADGGLVGANVMVALKDYEEHVKAAARAGADVVICGAGLPVTLPELLAGTDTKFAPIISTEKALNVLFKMWDKKYKTTADFVVIEGPRAGGHLGFSEEQLSEDINGNLNYDEEIRKIIARVRMQEEKYGRQIPVIVAGGIFDAEDVAHVMHLGADGVQVASRFVATRECDADIRYKEAYIHAGEDDVRIIKSPVGMPGRAVHNLFLEKAEKGECRVQQCQGCLAKCNPSEIPYCITDALIRAVLGDVENGLIFCGANVGKIKEISTVEEVISDLTKGFLAKEEKLVHRESFKDKGGGCKKDLTA